MIRIRTLLCAASAAFGLTLGLNASAATLTLNVDACDSFSLNNGVITCNTGSGTGTTPSCSLSASPSTNVNINTNVTVTATCSNTTSPVTYAWNVNSQGSSACTNSPGSSTNTCTVTSTSPTTISVAATVSDANGSVSVSPSSKSITFNDPGTPPPGVPATCDDGTKTMLAGNINDFDGASIGLANFNKAQTAYFVLKVPALGANTQVQLAWLSIGGFSDQVIRQVYASKTSVCDTSTPLTTGQAFNGSIFGTVNDGQSTITGAAKQGTLKMHLQPGDTWYIMFKNQTTQGKNSCSTGPCPIFIKPAILR